LLQEPILACCCYGPVVFLQATQLILQIFWRLTCMHLPRSEAPLISSTCEASRNHQPLCLLRG